MILALISLAAAYSFVLIGVLVLLPNKKERLNILAFFEYICFAVWSFSYTFLLIATNAESAMFWHRLGSIGWGMFCPVATHFFIVLTERESASKGFRYCSLLYLLPLAIVLNALFNPAGTSVTAGFVWVDRVGWVYQTNMRSIWYWLYLLHIAAYFTYCLRKVYLWAAGSNRQRFIKQAKSVLLLNTFVLFLGAFWDLVLPAFYPRVPPACHLVALFWAIGFLYIMKALKLTSADDAVTPDLILKTAVDPILVLSNNGIILKCNEATETMLKLKMDQIINRPFSDFYASGKYNPERVEQIFRGKQLRGAEIDFVDAEGEIISTMASFSLAETRLDGAVGIVASLHDVTALKKVETELNERNERNLELSRQLEVLANYDALTGLPNRRLFLNKVDCAIAEYKETGKRFALFFADLDGFKKVNDMYGHDIGDKLLQKCSELFKASVRKTDMITRFGGDEFILFVDQFDPSVVNVLMEKLKSAVAAPFVIDQYICSIGVSVGISRCPEDGTTSEELIKTADKRMYVEKIQKKDMPDKSPI